MNEKAYMEAMKGVEISPEMKQRILTKSSQIKHQREINMMGSKKRILLVAIAATMIFSTTALAASRLITSWTGRTSSVAPYSALPSTEQTIKDVGYAPVLIEAFDNGYVFKNGNVVENNFCTDDNDTVEQFKSFMFRYAKDEAVVILTQGKYTAEVPQAGTLITSENGYDIYFTGYTNKVVPVDYKMTEEDRKAENDGDLVFTYGSDNVSISEVMGIEWSVGDMHFGLLQIDGPLTADELTQMAQSVIAEVK